MLKCGVTLTETQKQRLQALGADAQSQESSFSSTEERDARFRLMERTLAEGTRRRLQTLASRHGRPALCRMEEVLADKLMEEGFVQVVTPIMMSKVFLERMSIGEGHPLMDQVFWVDENTCLRPMLAPNLYCLLRRLVRLLEKPVRIFEVGPCFRKDSDGRQHLNEFTMLNLVELGLPQESRGARISELASLLMNAAGIDKYHLVSQPSEVYGETFDIMTEEGMEVCSAAMGPHPLDGAWGIVDTWVGLGFGLERLAMAAHGHQNIQMTGRSLTYVGGLRLNV